MRKGIAGIILLLGAAVVFFTFNPETSAIFPRCPFLVLTGLHALLHGDIVTAFHYNALMVLSLPIIFLLLYAEACRTKRPAFYARVHRPVYIWIYFFLVLIWSVARNVFGW